MFQGDEIAAVLQEKFALTPGSVSGQTPLFSSGVLDSFHLLEVLAQLEEIGGVRVSPGELSLENFDTPARMAALLNRKLGRGA